jgi:hypothetical protein
MLRTSIFVSYSHRDETWLDRLRVHLAPLERELGAELWSDSRIRAGQSWNQELVEALNRSSIAILLVSADFLASAFIASEELPRLLLAAEQRGMTILPVIVGYSRFPRTPSLARFQAINDPAEPLISLTSSEQERILDKLSSRVEELLQNVPAADLTAMRRSRSKAVVRHESFTDLATWPTLSRIGEWTRNKRGIIRGGDVFHYILSAQEYGPDPFAITAHLRFSNIARFTSARVDNANPGIVFGWKRGPLGRRYLNMLFTGSRVLLEEVGASGGDDYGDFMHLDEGVALSLMDGKEYNVALAVGSSDIEVHVDGSLRYVTRRPHDITGFVGLRPWRSHVEVSHFDVHEL